MKTPHEILSEYWGYGSFRPKQEEIIQTVLRGEDVLALLPTGGGKSICFQVPAMCLPGLCVVVSPLVALMNDQVENLRRRNIVAYSVTSGMPAREVDRILDNCIYGQDTKFLYVSPERLQTELFQARFKKMNVGLIAVDEAHCISQWGYDFRPPYLEIAMIREEKPDVPLIAVTATATPHVVQDIMDRLKFRQRNVISSSFFRENLAYHVEYSEDKENRIIRALQKNSDSCIVYAGTRQQVKQLAYKIHAAGIPCTYYHAGLTHEERDAAYRSWLTGGHRVICATNAFGMGIDKPDVRLVIHAGVPQSIEAYFQEAGRAGRDGKKSHAIILYNHGDTDDLVKKVEQRYPDPEVIRKVYRGISSHLQLAVGAGQGMTYSLDLTEVSRKYDIPYPVCVFSMQILALAGLVTFEEKSWQPSRMMFLVSKNDLYSFQVANPRWDPFIRTLLRSYGGLFEQYMQIRESDLAKNLNTSAVGVRDALLKLKEVGVLDYVPHTDDPQLTFLTGRLREEEIRLPPEVYAERKKHETERAKAMSHYLQSDVCRSVLLLSYFGEKDNRPCGMCDVCRNPKTEHGTTLLHESAWHEIQRVLSDGPKYPDEIPELLESIPSDTLREVIRWHLDKGNLILDQDMRLCTKAQLS